MGNDRPKYQKFKQSKARNSGQPHQGKGIKREAAEVIGMRLNKYVAHSGLCSRRQAAELVKSGKIKVNGEILKDPSYQIKEGDQVMHKGELLEAESQSVYILLNKPRNVITTVKDEKGRRTVIDILGEQIKERVFPVGRLDRDTTGLLLLTNDGALAKKLMHPSHKAPKIYEATLDQPIQPKDLEAIKAGFELEDGAVYVNWINFPDHKRKDLLALEIHYGRNRIVRRIFEHFNYKVEKLDRVYLAGLNKKDLPRGYFRYLTEKEIIMLKHFTN